MGVFLTGCIGAEQKLGRGFNNVTELVRGGEISRSMEQTAIFNGPDVSYTTGFIHGLNRSLARTAVGTYEIVTFPLPPYDPVIFPANPVYHDAYKPGILADSIYATDTSMGFSGGEVGPSLIPGSRFRVFDEP
jgi:putative exosortase-associated protein (TIGR04073 family)